MSAARRGGTGLLILALGTSPAALDTSLNIAFPNITAAFALDLTAIQWVVISYMLTYGGLMLVFGRLGDLIGHRRVFRVGLGTTALGLLACGLAPTYGWLLVGRALQGVGVAAALSCAPALATALFPEEVRARALGAYGALFALGTALGPLLGGLLVQQWGWRAVFCYRVPVALAALVLSSRLPPGQALASAQGLSALSAGLLTLATSGVLLALAALEWDRLFGALVWLATLIAAAALVARERKVAEPILPYAAVGGPGVRWLHVLGITVQAASFAILLLVPYYLTDIAGLNAGWAGLLLSLSALGAILGSLAAGRLAAGLGARWTAGAGSLVCAGGLAAIAFWSERSQPLLQSAALIVQGLGLGAFQVAYSEVVIAALPAKDRGVAGSLVMLMRTIGIVTGAAGLSALFHGLESKALASGLVSREAFLAAFQATLAWCSIGVAAALVLIVRPRSPWQRRAPPQDDERRRPQA